MIKFRLFIMSTCLHVCVHVRNAQRDGCVILTQARCQVRKWGGGGGVRKTNVDLTSGRWPRWVARYEKGGGGGGGGSPLQVRYTKRGGGRGGGNSLQVRYEKWGGATPPWLRACHMNYMIKFLNNTNHMRCNGLLTVNMKRWTDTSFAARIWECCNVMMKYCTSNIQLVKTVGREKGVEESRGERVNLTYYTVQYAYMYINISPFPEKHS